MSRINPPIRNLRVVRVYTTEHEFIIHFRQQIQHSRTEKAGAGAEVFRGLEGRERGVGLLEEGFDRVNLRAEFIIGERAGRFVMDSVIC